jgi:hypothetical protein
MKHHKKHHKMKETSHAGHHMYRAVNGEAKHHGKGGGMIQEDMHAPSNCPTHVIQSEYPKVDYLYQPIDDTIYAIDHQMNSGVHGVRKQLATKKY